MSLPFPDTFTYRDANDPSVRISFDHRYFPILFAKPHKGWAEDAVRYYFEEWRPPLAEYAAARGMQIVIIFDMQSSEVPPATVRKKAGEFTASDSVTAGLLKSIVVVDNPMLRGVMTAIMWLAGEVPISFVRKLPEAIRSAIKELESRDIQAPDLDPDSYKFPIDF